jgi:hypothetical protein
MCWYLGTLVGEALVVPAEGDAGRTGRGDVDGGEAVRRPVSCGRACAQPAMMTIRTIAPAAAARISRLR